MDNASKLLELSTKNISSSKHLAVWNWFYQCPLFKELYFIFSDGSNGNVIISPDNVIFPSSCASDDIVKSYINRTFEKNYDFTVILFLPYTMQTNSTENIDWIRIVEGVNEWVEEQEKIGNYPNFLSGNSIQSITTLPAIDGISAQDSDGAKYQFTVRITYIDETNATGCCSI